MSYPSALASAGAAATTRAKPTTGATAHRMPTISSTVAPAARAASTLDPYDAGAASMATSTPSRTSAWVRRIERASRPWFRLSHQGGMNGRLIIESQRKQRALAFHGRGSLLSRVRPERFPPRPSDRSASTPSSSSRDETCTGPVEPRVGYASKRPRAMARSIVRREKSRRASGRPRSPVSSRCAATGASAPRSGGIEKYVGRNGRSFSSAVVRVDAPGVPPLMARSWIRRSSAS